MATTEPCKECGMPTLLGEYHPFAACLMFKGCNDPVTVRANLDAVTSQWLALGRTQKDHEIAGIVNRLTAISREFHDHASLRDRISRVVVPAIKPK